MEYAIIVFLVVTLIVILIVSDSKKLTCSSAIGLVGKTIYDWVKSMLPKNECKYPTEIGYDSNGCFCPGAVEKEFEDLGQILDGIYLSNDYDPNTGIRSAGSVDHRSDGMMMHIVID